MRSEGQSLFRHAGQRMKDHHLLEIPRRVRRYQCASIDAVRFGDEAGDFPNDPAAYVAPGYVRQADRDDDNHQDYRTSAPRSLTGAGPENQNIVDTSPHDTSVFPQARSRQQADERRDAHEVVQDQTFGRASRRFHDTDGSIAFRAAPKSR